MRFLFIIAGAIAVALYFFAQRASANAGRDALPVIPLPGVGVVGSGWAGIDMFAGTPPGVLRAESKGMLGGRGVQGGSFADDPRAWFENIAQR